MIQMGPTELLNCPCTRATMMLGGLVTM